MKDQSNHLRPDGSTPPSSHDHGPGLLLIISGPSGVGKTTITHRVEKQLEGMLSISMTTRPKTKADEEGVHYYFVDEAAFLAARDQGDLLEWAPVFDHFYGTPRQPVEASLASGKLVILEIDVDGAEQIKRNLPEAYAIFIEPPTPEDLLHRLRQRKRENEAKILQRFARAQDEIRRAHEGETYNRFIVNDKLEHAVSEAVNAVQAERQKRGSDD